MNFTVFLLLVISIFIPLWLDRVLWMVSIFINLLIIISWPNIWSILKNGPCTLEKNYILQLLFRVLYSCLVGLGDLYFYFCIIFLFLFLFQHLLFLCWSSIISQKYNTKNAIYQNIILFFSYLCYIYQCLIFLFMAHRFCVVSFTSSWRTSFSILVWHVHW